MDPRVRGDDSWIGYSTSLNPSIFAVSDGPGLGQVDLFDINGPVAIAITRL